MPMTKAQKAMFWASRAKPQPNWWDDFLYHFTMAHKRVTGIWPRSRRYRAYPFCYKRLLADDCDIPAEIDRHFTRALKQAQDDAERLLELASVETLAKWLSDKPRLELSGISGQLPAVRKQPFAYASGEITAPTGKDAQVKED